MSTDEFLRIGEMLRRCVLAILLLAPGLLSADTGEGGLFKRVLISIVSDHYGVSLNPSDIEFAEDAEGDNVWSSVLRINGIGEVTVIVENLNLCVILVGEKGPVLLFQGTQAPPPWTGGAADKTWIYEYILWRSRR